MRVELTLIRSLHPTFPAYPGKCVLSGIHDKHLAATYDAPKTYFPVCSCLFPFVPDYSVLFRIIPFQSRLFRFVPFYSRLFPIFPVSAHISLINNSGMHRQATTGGLLFAPFGARIGRSKQVIYNGSTGETEYTTNTAPAELLNHVQVQPSYHRYRSDVYLPA